MSKRKNKPKEMIKFQTHSIYQFGCLHKKNSPISLSPFGRGDGMIERSD